MKNLLGKIVEVKGGLKGRVVVCNPLIKRYCVAYLKPNHTQEITTWEKYEKSFHFYSLSDRSGEVRLTRKEFDQITIYGFDTYRHNDFVKIYGELKSWFIKSLEEKY